MLDWATRHPVAANLAMVLVVALGVLSAMSLTQRTFPEFSLDTIQVRVDYPGATPSEIEQSVIRPIEDRLSAVDGVDEMTSVAAEGGGTVTLSLRLGENVSDLLDEISAEVDRIETFPDDAEEPEVVELVRDERVLEIEIFGEASERTLKEVAERLERELSELPSVSSVETANVRAYEISIEIDRAALRAYGLTLGDVSRIVGQNSLELPAGAIESSALSIPLRTVGRTFDGEEFADIVLLTTPDGAIVRLGDVAVVRDGFEDSDLSAAFGEAPTATVNVFLSGGEQVLQIVEDVNRYIEDVFRPTLPDGLEVVVWVNEAEELQNRLDLLIKNAFLGLGLVVLCLALFLDLRLAFWSAVGIGVAFAASFAAMAVFGMSINQISLFGFILAIGIVVDNAIVIGENIFKNGERGAPPMSAAVKGVQRVAVPVVFSALTTIVAFWPLTQLPGVLGKFLSDIPYVVMIVLTLSLLQALFLLPRNLSALDVRPDRPRSVVIRIIDAVRGAVDRGLQWFIAGPLDRTLRFITARTLIPIAGVVALMILTVGLLAHGYVRFQFFPSIEGKFVTAQVELIDGAAFERSEDAAEALRAAAVRAAARIDADAPSGSPPIIENLKVVVGSGPVEGGPNGGSAASGANLSFVTVRLVEPVDRAVTATEFANVWREEVGDLAGLRELTFTSRLVDVGDAIALELSTPDGVDVGPALADVRESVAAIPGVFDLRDDRSSGRIEYTLALRDEARVYGVSLQELARQMRDAFFGAEAVRVQRGDDDVRVYVRLPSAERASLADLLDVEVRTPSGDFIPLGVVATITEAVGPSEILRRDGRAITTLTADVDPAVITGDEANRIIRDDILPAVLERYDGLAIGFGGEQREQGDAGAALGAALGVALFVIYALLALVFRSYIQPIVVMTAIPLGLIGAVAGHLIMDLNITLLSIFGLIGLAGVVINNSLVMIDLYNEYLDRGMALRDAVVEGTKDRFRPILLTSLTTFLGVFPLILETSVQAQFLIPLAVSIGFGVLFGTVIIVLSVPAVFVAQARLFGGVRGAAAWLGRLDRRMSGRPAAASSSVDPTPTSTPTQAAE